VERVTGIGGFFFRARDPDALRRWYADQLGVDPTPTSYDEEPWTQEAGPTAFEAFDAEGDFFGTDKPWVINFRVRDLDAMVEQLRAAGSEVEVDPETYPIGRFASTNDPEGNPIQLWQPS
jgi:predicted enzyme related to lactoylglutathione lyase